MHRLTLDGVSGSVPVAERLKGGALFAKLAKGDVVIAPKLDRLFHSALDALTVVEDLRKRDVSLRLLDLGGDGLAEAVPDRRRRLRRGGARPDSLAHRPGRLEGARPLSRWVRAVRLPARRERRVARPSQDGAEGDCPDQALAGAGEAADGDRRRGAGGGTSGSAMTAWRAS